MNIPFYHVDAFTSRVFAGNPAGVCILERWPDDADLQAIDSSARLTSVPAIRTSQLIAASGKRELPNELRYRNDAHSVFFVVLRPRVHLVEPWDRGPFPEVEE